MSKYIRRCIYGYNMTGRTGESNRYMLQVGNNRFRREIWESIKDICAIEGTPMADEIWQALDMHVRAYAERQNNNIAIKTKKALDKLPSEDDGGDGRIHMPRPKAEPELEESTDNIFDKIVEETVHEATEEEVEEVVREARAEDQRMATSDMFRHYKKR